MRGRQSRPLQAGLGLLLMLVSFPACAAQASEIGDGEAAFRAGRYEEAISILEKHLGSGDPRAVRGLARALAEVGRYGEAEQKLRSFGEAHPQSAESWNLLGEMLRHQGKLNEAEDAFQKAIAGGASDSLTAELNLAVLVFERGQYDEAMRRFDRFIDVYNQSRQLSSETLTAVASACRYLSREDPALRKDALKAFDEAIAADSTHPEPRVLLGELFLEAYNSSDAEETFNELLAANPLHPRGLYGMARVADFNGVAMALDYLEKALTVNPNLVPARAFRARILISHEDYPQARQEAEKALAVNPRSSEALAMLAAAALLSGDTAGFEQARRRALELNQKNADFFVELAEVSVQNRLYREAVEFARQAAELDPKSWQGFGQLGLNQLRLGEIEEGRKNLEASFAGDPYNVWIKNTLDLLDTFPDYRATASARFSVLVDRKESDLLGPYVAELAEEAYDALAERYGYRPPPPLRIEVFRSHADFSVRTVGLAGLGALGVCFGRVLALDSPSAREKGKFSWGSTLWHELAHAFTLGLTEHKIPRWLTEGLSVVEEHRARPGWGDDVSPDFLIAFKQGKLLPLQDLNDGFMRPRFPQQIAFSYFQASLICDLIERDHGFAAILALLDGYRQGKTTEELFRTVLVMELKSFDQKLSDYLNQRFGKALAALRAPSSERVEILSKEAVAARAGKDPQDFAAQLALGESLYKEKKLDEALPYLERARSLFPEYAGDDSPYLYLASIYKEKGELGKAAEELARFTSINESHYPAHLELADLLEKRGDRQGAAEALERAVYIWPLDMSLHTRLAELHAGLGHWPAAIRERRAVVALAPVDRAEALYQLARTHFLAGDRAAARREVLKALEVAPNFDKAQQLLLEIRGAPSSSRKGEGK
jgi:tetratricopeptide (TPR) repeat protein